MRTLIITVDQPASRTNHKSYVPAIDPEFSYRSEGVVQVLDKVR